MTIRTRLVLSSFLLQVLSMALLGWGVLIVRTQYQERDMRALASTIEMAVGRAASDSLIQKDDVALLSYLKFLKVQYPAISQARIQWRSHGRGRGAVVGEGGAARPRTARFTVADPADPQRAVDIDLTLDEAVLDLPFQAANARLGKIILSVWAVTSLLGLLVAFLIARGLVKPIVDLSRLAGEIGGGKLGGRLAWESDDELGGLVRAFNSMSSRLEEFDTVKRNFVSSVTHELRSPSARSRASFSSSARGSPAARPRASPRRRTSSSASRSTCGGSPASSTICSTSRRSRRERWSAC
ncbi:MAG: HAMP domain-containing protein [Elusimicrobiota bacterium]|nr:MAG: HAMP domain-containing protein [Elusimicrobiota bacterium]